MPLLLAQMCVVVFVRMFVFVSVALVCVGSAVLVLFVALMASFAVERRPGPSRGPVCRKYNGRICLNVCMYAHTHTRTSVVRGLVKLLGTTSMLP